MKGLGVDQLTARLGVAWPGVLVLTGSLAT